MSAPAGGRGDGGAGAGEQLSLIPEPEFSPSMPKPSSRRAAILEAFRRGECLTHADALRRGWGWRLAADVHALKELHGWPILSEPIHQDGGNPIARYWIPAEKVARHGG